MTGMQNIETAIGESDPQVLLAPIPKPGVELTARRDDLFFSRKECMRQNLAAQFGQRYHRDADLADGDGRRGVGDPQRRFPIGTPTASTAATVSPAPETSRTLTG